MSKIQNNLPYLYTLCEILKFNLDFLMSENNLFAVHNNFHIKTDVTHFQYAFNSKSASKLSCLPFTCGIILILHQSLPQQNLLTKIIYQSLETTD